MPRVDLHQFAQSWRQLMGTPGGEGSMFDALFVLIGLTAFALTVLYAVACEHI
ncbi:MAG: hypothetical protein ACREFL_22005 [Stellaceae bacterium]